MTKTWKPCLLALCLMPLSALACKNASIPRIPAEDQIHGQEKKVTDELRNYLDAVQTYLDCIQDELSAGGDDASDTFKSLLVKRNNLAVAEAQAVSDLVAARIQTAPPTEEK